MSNVMKDNKKNNNVIIFLKNCVTVNMSIYYRWTYFQNKRPIKCFIKSRKSKTIIQSKPNILNLTSSCIINL